MLRCGWGPSHSTCFWLGLANPFGFPHPDFYAQLDACALRPPREEAGGSGRKQLEAAGSRRKQERKQESRRHNFVLVGGFAGALHGRHQAQQQWSAKNMYEERDAMGAPFFRRRLHDGVGEIFEMFDHERWDAMGRNYAKSYIPEGMLQGALLGAAGTMIARDRRFRLPERPQPPPPRLLPPPPRQIYIEILPQI